PAVVSTTAFLSEATINGFEPVCGAGASPVGVSAPAMLGVSEAAAAPAIVAALFIHSRLPTGFGNTETDGSTPISSSAILTSATRPIDISQTIIPASLILVPKRLTAKGKLV